MHHPDVCPPKSSFLRFQRGRHLVEETEAHVLIGLLLLLLLLLSGGSLGGTTGSGGGGSGTSTTGGNGGELGGTLSDQL
jgi:hypothetical protein